MQVSHDAILFGGVICLHKNYEGFSDERLQADQMVDGSSLFAEYFLEVD